MLTLELKKHGSLPPAIGGRFGCTIPVDKVIIPDDGNPKIEYTRVSKLVVRQEVSPEVAAQLIKENGYRTD